MTDKLSILNPYPEKQQGPALLHHLLRQDQDTETTAIDFSGPDGGRTSYSYGEIHERSNHLARQLLSIRNTLPPSARFIVPLYIPQCPELYISQLGILKAGGAFCPIPLDVPAERLRFILQDAEARILITTKDYRDRLPELQDVATIIVDELQRPDHEDPSLPHVEIAGSDPAYVMYTSGSTGQPKGVLLSHNAATQALLAHQRHIPFFSRFLQFASPTFDVSVFEIFFPLFRGATLVVCDRKRLLDDLPGTINALGIDAAELTPSVASSLLRGRESVPQLRVLLTIGEMLKRPIVEDFGGSEDSPALLQGMYGPTEATIHCTLQPDFMKDMSVNNIGVPLDTVSAFIVRPKPDDKPQSSVIDILQIGEEGELAVGGHQLADGYLKRQEQTDAAFVPHPKYGRLYRTGDKARMQPDGRIYCLGRISSGQVKLRGQRIELGEIEYAASRTPGCRDVVADVIDSNTLVTFCVRENGATSEDDVRNTCREWLPAYMVPQEVLLLDSLPYLASGKIDRNSLRNEFLQNRRSQSSETEPNTQQQKHLVEIFSRALGAELSVDTPLAAAGVDSLGAIRITSRLRQHGFGQVSAVDVLESTSILQLDERLLYNGLTDSPETQVLPSSHDHEFTAEIRNHPLVQLEVEKLQHAFPCTAAQAAMLSQTARDPQAYCNWINLTVESGHEQQQVMDALLNVAKKHEMLRSGFVSLNRSDITHATIVWTELSDSQIQTATQNHPDFELRTELDFLRPCRFKLVNTHGKVGIILQIHHSLYDQWSIDVLRKDLASCLAGSQLQSASSFQAISEHHRSQLTSKSASASEEFWEDHLRGCAATTLPLMRGDRVSPHLGRTSWQPLDLGQSLRKDLIRDLGISPHVVFQAAMAYMLSMYVGNPDVTYGTVFSGRHLPVVGVEDVFGPCLTTLPSRIDLASCRTSQDLLQTLHERNRAMLKHSLTPPAVVKKASGLAPGATLFDSLFVWQESTVTQEASIAVNEVDSADYHEFSLVLEFEPTAAGVQARGTYQQSLMSAEQVALLLRQIANLARCMLDTPSGLISELSSSFPEPLLSASNPNPSPCEDERGIVGAIQENARLHPKSPALVFASTITGNSAETETLSYEQLDERSSNLASTISTIGVLPGDLVCICTEKSANLYISMLATLKAGAGYLPLTPETPMARCSAVLDQAIVKLCICDHGRAESFRTITSATVFDVEQDEWVADATDYTAASHVGSNVAYTVFTSGSTGTPKGVSVTFDNLLGNLAVLSEIYPAERGDRMLQACSQAFDVSVFEIFFTFYKGMTLCTATRDTLFADIEAGIRALGVTHLSMTPTVAALARPEQVPKVRFLVTAGEAMTDLVHQRWSGKGLYQGYGPSETTNICSVLPEMQLVHQLGNVGPPFRNTSTFVVPPGDSLDVLPKGAFGELAYGGQQVFPGYIGNEQLNAQKLVDHPAYGRLYRSGDMGRLLPDGSISIGGRLDDQVKIRGNRIELGEITSVLMRDSAVLDAIATVITTESSGQRLAAFWVPNDVSQSTFRIVDPQHGPAQHTGQLYQALEAALTAYMVPSVILPVTAMPRTSQGKIDKRALEAAVKTLDDAFRTAYSRAVDEDSDDDDEADWSEMEITLAKLFCESFRVPSTSVKRTSSFFALGLDSLNAIAFTRAVQGKIGSHASIGVVLKNPTVSRLARALSDTTPRSSSKQLQRVREVFSTDLVQRVKDEYAAKGKAVEAVLPCTPLQEAMLSASASASSSAYSNITVLRINCDVDLMKRCWSQLLARQRILRTQFVETPLPAHPFAQVQLGDIEIPWTTVTVHCQAVDMIIKEALDQTISSTVTATAPLQFVAVQSPVGYFLLLQMHHAIYDGVSMSVLIDEIESLVRGEQLPAPVSSEPFLDEVLAHGEQAALEFWSTTVKDFSPKPFPKPNEPSQTEDQVKNFRLEVFGQELSDFTKRHTVTALSVFQAAVAKTLSSCQDSADICFGNVVSGRTVSVPDVDRLAMPCFNTLPVRIDTATKRSNIDLIRSLQTHNAQSNSHQLTPLRRIQRLSASPSQGLFDLLLLVQPPSKPPDENVWSLVDDRGAMDLPVVLEIFPEGEGFKTTVHWQSSRVSAVAIEALVDVFQVSLKNCLQYPSSSISDVRSRKGDKAVGILAPDPDSVRSITNGPNSSDNGVDSTEEWTETETTIRAIFVQMSSVPERKVGKRTPIYSLGLDSLNAVQVASQLRKQGLQISAADVMEHQTVAALARFLATGGDNERTSKVIVDLEAFDKEHRDNVCNQYGLTSSHVQAVRPCTQVQCGMLAQSLNSEGSLYVNHVSFNMPSELQTSNIEEAWRAVQRKHQLLRAGFFQTEDADCPFATIMYKPTSAATPMTTGNAFGCLEDAESAASQAISENLQSFAWQVSLAEKSGKKTMIVSMHHALYDADSLQVVLADFSRALRSEALGSERSVDPLLKSVLQETESCRLNSQAFWKDAASTASVTNFPNLTPTVVPTSEQRSINIHSSSTIESLRALTAQHSTTIQVLGQAAWAKLLAAYVGEPVVTFGTVLSCRSDTSHEGLVFPAITTLPVSCNTDLTSNELLADMAKYNVGLQRHRCMPLAEIQRLAGVDDRALFDSVFVLQTSSAGNSDRLSWDMVRETAGVDYAVSLELEMLEGGVLNLRLTFDTAKVAEAHATLILRQYDELLSGIMQDSGEVKLSKSLLSILPAGEPTISSDVTLLHEFVEASAATCPGKTALEFVDAYEGKDINSRSWSYQEFNARSDQVAHLLMRSGVSTGDIVAVCMDKCPEASMAFVGILKAGCSFLAIDPDLPSARRQFILQDSGARLILLDRQDSELESSEVPTTPLVLSEKLIEAQPPTPVKNVTVKPTDTCYCLYTSGTTGNPKGCEITHDNAVQAMLAFQRLFAGRWDASSKWLQFASYWFDVSILEQFWSWGVGVSVVAAPRDLVLEDLTGFIRALNITHIDLTPSLARLVHPDEVPSLCGGVFITGGEALKQEIINAWGPEKTICNGYGPTEATIGVTMNTFVGADAKPSNIGPQFDNVGSYVLVPGTDQPVMRGALGELCISGKLVGKGYLNRPELTAKAFPFLERFGEKVYRTGDLVRLLADGSFAFAGRKDTQAKLRGQRLELAEIDAIIKEALGGKSDAATLVHKAANGSKELLVGFLSTSTGAKRPVEVDDSDLGVKSVAAARDACLRRLPGYMVPSHILPISKLPLTVNNKVDNKRLVALYEETSSRWLQSLQQPNTGAKLSQGGENVFQVLSKLLNVAREDVSGTSNLFSLGLSSVSAISFASLLKKAGFSKANVATIMKNPTLNRLAEALNQTEESYQDHDAIKQAELSISATGQRYRSLAAKRLSLAASEIEVIAPCTPLQQGLLYESQNSTTGAYFNTFMYDLRSADVNKLKIAFQKVVDGVQTLRTAFIQTDDGHIQTVANKAALRWKEYKVSEEDRVSVIARSHAAWLEANKGDVLHPFELTIIRTPTATQLVVQVHHALYDGISWDLLMIRVAEAYGPSNTVDCGPAFIDALPYGPLREQKDAKEFWGRTLGSSSEQMNRDRTNNEGRICQAKATLASSDAAENTRRSMGVSHQAIVQASFAIALSQVFESSRMFGLVVSGRSIEFDGADRVLGPLFNTLPCPISMSNGSTWEGLVRQYQDFNSAALPYQHTPLRQIRKWTARAPDDPMFDSLLVFQHQTEQSDQLDSAPWREVESKPSADYPLALEVVLNTDGSSSVTAVAQQATLDQSSLEMFLRHYEEAYSLATQHPSDSIDKSFTLPSSGEAPPSTNGNTSYDHLNGVEHFQWTEDARALQKTIAALAGADANAVDEHSSLFSLGLDSIDAVKLASRLKKVDINLPVSELLRAQTIPRMLRSTQGDSRHVNNSPGVQKLTSLEEQLSSHLRDSGTLARLGSVERVLPTTPIQESLIAKMLESDFEEYYNHDVLLLEPHTDIERLKAAWQSVVDQSPILRTSFVEVDSPVVQAVFAQIVHQPTQLNFKHVHLDSTDALQDHFTGVAEDVRNTYEVQSPLRLSVAHIESSTYLVLSISHAQYDGHSLALIHEDVQRAYRGSYSPRPSYDGIIEASLQANNQDALDFWRDSLSGCSPSNFPKNDVSATQTIRTDVTSKTSVSTAQAFCQQRGISLQGLAQMSWALTLAYYTKSMEVVYGVVLACRDSEESEQVVFPTMNTVPIRAALHGSREQMVGHMQSAINDMLSFQRTPLRVIQNIPEIARQASNGLFDSLFIYQHRPDSTSNDSDPSLYSSTQGASDTEYAVAVELEATAGSIVLRVACKDNVLDHAGARGLLQTYDTVLSNILQYPTGPTVAFAGEGASVCGLDRINMTSRAPDPLDDGRYDDATSRSSAVTSPVSQELRQALAEVSKTDIEDITGSSTIQSIGIDSISAIKVASILRKQSIPISVRDILRAEDIGSIAGLVASNGVSKPNAEGKSSQQVIADLTKSHGVTNIPGARGFKREDIEKILPATAGQVYMLNTWQTSEGQLFYPTFSYEVKGTPDLEDLRRSWDRLVAKHEVLRTTFRSSSNSSLPYFQIILQNSPDSFAEGTPSAANGISSQQPMACLYVERKHNADWSLHLKIHHALYDAVSLPILMEDLEALIAGQTPEVNDITQVDYLALSSTSQAKQSQRLFWTNYLQSADPLRLSQPVHSGAQTRAELFQPSLIPSTQALEQGARQHGLSSQTLLFASFARIYAHLANENQAEASQPIKKDVVIGLYLSNRSHIASLPSLATPTLNLVPLLVRAPLQTSIIDSARQIQQDLREISTAENSAVGLWEISEWTHGRVEVDAFVNFIKLPDTATDESSGGSGKGAVSLTPATERREGFSRLNAPEANRKAFQSPPELRTQGTEPEIEKVRAAYKHSLDLEATVTSEGALDVGIFAPETMVGGLAGAGRVVEELKSDLEGWVKK